ncbi:MAG: hypothetical protein ACLU6Y_11645 [Ruminococcus sp.]
MNRNKKILNVTMAAGMAAVLGTTPVIAAAQEADNGVSQGRNRICKRYCRR